MILCDQWEIPVSAPDREEASQPEIGVRCGERVQMAVIPIGALRQGSGNVIGVSVRHPGRNVQHHIVGIALGTDMRAVCVKVDWRRGHLRRIEWHLFALRRVSRIEEVADRQAS